MTRPTRKTLKVERGDPTPLGLPGVGAVVVLKGEPADIGVHRVVDRPCFIGRGPGVDLALLDPALSRRHCVVIPTTGGALLQDLGSLRGTLLNEEPITGPVALGDGDHIFIGETVLKFSSTASPELRFHARMDERVGTDELTGLMARHRFEGALVRALEVCGTAKLPLGLMMLDLDGIKQINDTHGHLFGAHTIAEAGRLIGRVVGPRGAACRFGGDEFAAFLPRHSRESTVEQARAIVNEVASTPLEKDGVALHPTISIGVAAFPDDGRDTVELTRKADEALNRAKLNGRNRVET
jgi:diguanylate cyclase (GGDEF)-like protein